MRFLALRPARRHRRRSRSASASSSATLMRAGRAGLGVPAASKGQDVWERLNLFDDETVAFTRDGYVDVEGPQQIEAGVDPRLKALIPEPHYWLRVRLDQNRYPAGRAPRLEYLLPNAVDAVNLQTETEQRCWARATAAPTSASTFPDRPVEPDSLVIEVPRRHRPRHTVDAARRLLRLDARSERHFVLDARGRDASPSATAPTDEIPPAGADHRRADDGATAAAPPATTSRPAAVKTMVTQVAGIEKVTNLRAATGGRRRRRHRRRSSSGRRASCGAAAAPSPRRTSRRCAESPSTACKKARALGGRHPDFPGVEVPGAITVAGRRRLRGDAAATRRRS